MEETVGKIRILSPDGFDIDPYVEDDYTSQEVADKAFDDWKSRFESQGYYSSNNGRIPLNELRNHCKFITL